MKMTISSLLPPRCIASCCRSLGTVAELVSCEGVACGCGTVESGGWVLLAAATVVKHPGPLALVSLRLHQVLLCYNF